MPAVSMPDDRLEAPPHRHETAHHNRIEPPTRRDIEAPVHRRIEVPPDPRDLPGPFHHVHAIEVRFADTDAMGHVNNALYHTYVETARTRYLEVVLDEPVRLGVHGELSFILAEARMVYRSPAYYGETLSVETRMTRIGRSSMSAEHRITAPDSHVGRARLVAVCESVLVHYDYGRATPIPVPADVAARIEAFEGHSLRASR
jgi:acyl-CoA thioester hydrolase